MVTASGFTSSLICGGPKSPGSGAIVDTIADASLQSLTPPSLTQRTREMYSVSGRRPCTSYPGRMSSPSHILSGGNSRELLGPDFHKPKICPLRGAPPSSTGSAQVNVNDFPNLAVKIGRLGTKGGRGTTRKGTGDPIGFLNVRPSSDAYSCTA
eukprot:CAMPEP_0169138932 /NCGR_PEP_ID=MMETSP1015-20121227/42637_1 /TAXON_ID=342587 /ORGANISM="Karlodinium micrum, Strain CCMP2283" /LENGTH=153 /DNA_ID=CAMNT_0009204479 /DNA_START=2393 /DNA_END=2854 /DNA_ORIENTATION=-